jgi:hypothetical protein
MIGKVGVSKGVTIDGDLCLEESVIMGSVKNIGHATVLLYPCLWMFIAAVAHLLVELMIEKKRDELKGQGYVLIDLFWLPISTVTRLAATWTSLKFCMLSSERNTGLLTAVVAFCKKLGELLQPFLHPMECAKVTSQELGNLLHQVISNPAGLIDLQ